jgi:hypothetical protein
LRAGGSGYRERLDRKTILIEELDRAASQIGVGKDCAESADERRRSRARDEKGDIRNIAAERREQTLRTERCECRGVTRIDVAKVRRRRLAGAAIGGGAAELEAGASRGEHHAARRSGVEKIRREIVWGGLRGRGGVPVDFTPDAAERTISASRCSAADRASEIVTHRGRIG